MLGSSVGDICKVSARRKPRGVDGHCIVEPDGGGFAG